MHLSSFPGPDDAIGTPGFAAQSLLEKMHESGFKLLQLLPLGPVGSGNSPYSSPSAFAIEPLFIDLETLKNHGLIDQDDLDQYISRLPTSGRTEYSWLKKNKRVLLKKAWLRFYNSGQAELDSYKSFQQENRHWLVDYTLFAALKEIHHGKPWYEWPEQLRNREGLDIHKLDHTIENEVANISLIELVNFNVFLQYTIQLQWNDFREKARNLEIEILGDCPIFVSYDSVDVWARPDLFQLNEKMECEYVAGVPPDYFSTTGQKWGNPLYDWPIHKDSNYEWWTQRLQRIGYLCDSIRIDHFRGFDEYWAIQADAPDARNGSWEKGPGMDFFEKIQGNTVLPKIIAEDLGMITDSVRLLLENSGFPGMRIFEFVSWGQTGFEEDGKLLPVTKHTYLPENWPDNCVGYPGTHDNDTLQGWYSSLDTNGRNSLLEYLDLIPENYIITTENSDHVQQDIISDQEREKNDPSGFDNDYIPDLIEISSDFIAPTEVPLWPILKRIFSSKSCLVIVNMQDLLLQGSDYRMNTPGTSSDENWSYRLTKSEDWDPLLTMKLQQLISDTHR